MIKVIEGRDTVFSRFDGNIDSGSILDAEGRKTVDKNGRGRKGQEGEKSSENTHFERMLD